ncbi:DNA repair protein RecO [Synechococcales cyanobacterium CNB]|nr:DNA repair protein RecO [cyanobacterium CYA1]MDL1905646.1 DNA repair protein RecO [Synechococcales cyanobacterium CNB]
MAGHDTPDSSRRPAARRGNRPLPLRVPSCVPTVRDQAVCVRHWDWSETSQTVSVFTREHGLIRGIAKGARREKAAFSGGLELLTRGELVAIVKPSGSLATLTAWDLQETFPALRRSLATFNAGMYLADLVCHSITDEDPHPALFDALLSSLRTIGDSAAKAILHFQWATLVETGYKPALGREPAEQARAVYGFSPRAGGLVSIAQDEGDNTPSAPFWRVRSPTVELLRRLESGHSIGGDAASIDRANRLLAAYLREILGRDLPTVRWVFGKRPLTDAPPSPRAGNPRK